MNDGDTGIPTLTNFVSGPRHTADSQQVKTTEHTRMAALRQRIEADTRALVGSLVDEAVSDFGAALRRQVEERLAAELPGLIDRSIAAGEQDADTPREES